MEWYYVSFCIWLVSLSVLFSKFIPVEACIRISLLLKAEYYSVCKYHILFNDSITDGHLHCFHLLAAAMNMSVYISIWAPVFSILLGMPRSRIVRSYNTMFSFLKNCQTVFHTGYIILHSYQQCKKVPISSGVYHHFAIFLFLSWQ